MKRVAHVLLTLFVGLIVVAIAYPAIESWWARRQTSRGTGALRPFADAVIQVVKSGGALPSHAPRTPPDFNCVDGEPRPPINRVGWDHPSWRAIGFEAPESIYLYELLSDGRSFTARVVGDLDCDGVLSTFDRVGTFMPDGQLDLGPGIWKKNEME